MTRFRVWTLAAAAFVLAVTQPWTLLAQAPAPATVKFAAIKEADMREFLGYLASDALQGRQIYTEGYGLAAGYIADHLRQWGLKPMGDDGTYFDTTAFARVTEVRFGDVGRNSMRGLGVVNLDLGLFRSFKIKASELQFRLEAFNATNTPHFGNPNGNVNSANFGRILATQSADAMGRSRQFRVGLRMQF